MRERIRPLTVLIVTALLVLAGIAMAMPAAAQAFHGDVKVHQDPGESEPVDRNNEPKLCATAPYSFHIHGNGFDLSATGWWAIYDDWSGTTKHVALDGHWATTGTSDSWTSTSLALPDGHYKLEYDYDSDASGNAKSKVFKLDCPAIPGDGTINVLKYNDLNGSGSQQGNEPGLQGWSFTVKNAQHETAGTIQTCAGG